MHDDIENTSIIYEFLLDSTESEEKLQNIDNVQQTSGESLANCVNQRKKL